MTNVSSINVSNNSFAFSFHTSSGDEISLSMYDNKDIEIGASSSESGDARTMSLRHEMGYSFHYEGNGIDANDKKEIEKAMKTLRPIYQKFLKGIEKSEKMPGYKELVNLSHAMRHALPEPKTPDMHAMMKEKTVDMMDDTLKLFDRNDKLLEATKKLFDRLFHNSKGFDLYA
jgi:hypothetical protein